LLSFIARYRILLFTAIGTWLIYVAHNLSVAYRLQANPELALLNEGLKDLILFMFFLANILVIRQIIGELKQRNPAQLLWYVLITGLTGLLILMVTGKILARYDGTPAELFTHPFLEALELYVLLIFLFSAIYTFRKFIFFIRNKSKYKFWQLFEFLLLLGLILVFENPFVFISEWIKAILLLASLVLMLYFCTYIRWVGYLSLRQKLNTIFRLFLCVFLLFVFSYKEDLFSYSFRSLIHEFFFYNYFMLGQVALFIAIYSIYSILVLAFNLPTSSVYEQTRSDLESFQKIQRSILPGQAKEGTLRTLLEAVMLSSEAQYGWVELDSNQEYVLSSGLLSTEVDAIKQNLNLRRYVLELRRPYNIPDLFRFNRLKVGDKRFRSLIVLPIQTRFTSHGALFVLKDIPVGFNEENLQVLQSFADQAALALENITLTEKSIEIERFQEQLAIARQMQEKLYPLSFPSHPDLEVFAMNQQAEAVGGDYYDIICLSPGKYCIVIGDVSGKGTTAAFYMAEMKGMFQVLARTDISPKAFITTVNLGLAQCLDKGSFITLTYLILDINTGKSEMIRAGHCPTLFYSAKNQSLEWLKEGGPALGVFRDSQFDQHINSEALNIEAGDRFILYTDGILEARNDKGEEYGYDRLKTIVQSGIQMPPKELSEMIIEHVKLFSGGYIEDDFTLMIMEVKCNTIAHFTV